MSKTSDIRAAVEAELRFDPRVDDADVHVVNMNGDVALNGTVPSYPQYLEAAAATQRVAGVKDVHNHLQVVLPDAGLRDDAMLTTAANNALDQNITVPDSVEATALDGNLTLTGTVEFGVERAAAERAVTGLTGVRNVRDEIEISYDDDRADVDLHVQEALDRSALPDRELLAPAHPRRHRLSPAQAPISHSRLTRPLGAVGRMRRSWRLYVH